MKSPVLIFLSSTHPQHALIAEVVEVTSKVSEIAKLIESRGLTNGKPFRQDFCVISKKHDGSAVQVICVEMTVVWSIDGWATLVSDHLC